MAKTQHTVVTVYRVERGPVSTYGNPSFVFKTDSGDYRTQTDSGMAYGLENDWQVNTGRYREFNKTGSRDWIDGPATVELEHTPAGRVISYRFVIA
jgi:hypothetical protein